MLTPVRITGSESPLYARFMDVYEASFPYDERRSPAAQAAAFAHPRYRLHAWLDGTRFAGLMGWWDFDAFRYIEHVAVAPEARSSGYGGRIMRRWMDMAKTPVYLEIEKVVDEITARRREFYKRLGFADTGMQHKQPPYQGDGPGVPLQVLSWPLAIDKAEYERFAALLFGDVWAQL